MSLCPWEQHFYSQNAFTEPYSSLRKLFLTSFKRDENPNFQVFWFPSIFFSWKSCSVITVTWALIRRIVKNYLLCWGKHSSRFFSPPIFNEINIFFSNDCELLFCLCSKIDTSIECSYSLVSYNYYIFPYFYLIV